MIDYDGFQIWLDCDKRGAVRFEYTATADSGNLPRHSDFYLDSSFDASCQQLSTDSYQSVRVGYDRGHLVPANHLDHLPQGIRESNYMINILPQALSMNRGAWLRTEEIIECRRDSEDLTVIGGALYGFNPHDDHYLASHGVATPDYFWKVVIAQNYAIAWIVPNVPGARRSELDRYIVRIRDLEFIVWEDFDVTDTIRNRVHTTSWPIPPVCDLS